MEDLKVIRERLDRIISEQKINKAKLAEVADVSAQAVFQHTATRRRLRTCTVRM